MKKITKLIKIFKRKLLTYSHIQQRSHKTILSSLEVRIFYFLKSKYFNYVLISNPLLSDIEHCMNIEIMCNIKCFNPSITLIIT